jgi:hypothetical protein
MRDLKRAGKPNEVSVIFGLDTGTLANLRSQKRGPRYYRQGRGIFYFLEDVEKWLKSNPIETIDSIHDR